MRRTRAHPSPSGFRQLEDQPRKRTSKAGTKKTVKAAPAAQTVNTKSAVAQAIDAPTKPLSAPVSASPFAFTAGGASRRQSVPSPSAGALPSQPANDHDVALEPQAANEPRSTLSPSSIRQRQHNKSQPSPSPSATASTSIHSANPTATARSPSAVGWRSLSTSTPSHLQPTTHNEGAMRRSPRSAEQSPSQKKKSPASTTPRGRERTSSKAQVHNKLNNHGRFDPSTLGKRKNEDFFDMEALARAAKRPRNMFTGELYQYNYDSDSSVDMEELERGKPVSPITDREHEKNERAIRDIRRRREQSRKQRMAKEKNTSYLIVPANSVEEKLVLNRSDIIDATRCLAKWAERDPSNPVPNAEQLEALLETFKTQELAKTAASQGTGEVREPAGAAPEGASTRHRDEAKQPDPSSPPIISGAGITQPETTPVEPTSAVLKTPERKESRLWNTVSKVKDIVTTPFNFSFASLRAGGVANDNSETPFKLADKNLPPIPESPTRNPGRIRRRAPTTDKPADKMRFTSGIRARDATSHRGPSATPIHRAQTERRKRSYRDFTDKNRIPIQFAGVVSQERIKEIQDQQDREAADRLAKARQESRRARVEDEETSLAREHSEDGETLAQAGQKTGGKRKRRSVKTPPKNPPGTFTVPYESSSSEGSSGSESEKSVEVPRVIATTASPTPQWKPRQRRVRKEKAEEPAAKKPLNVFDPAQRMTEAELARFMKGSPPGAAPIMKTPPFVESSPVSPDYMVMDEKSSPLSPDYIVVDEKSPPVSPDYIVVDDKSPPQGALDSALPRESQQTAQWQQTPPAKPRPGNARLPPQPSALALANVTKYQPKHPSKLRVMTKMSPLHVEAVGKENAVVLAEGEGPRPFTFKLYSEEVLAAVERLPENFWLSPE